MHVTSVNVDNNTEFDSVHNVSKINGFTGSDEYKVHVYGYYNIYLFTYSHVTKHLKSCFEYKAVRVKFKVCILSKYRGEKVTNSEIFPLQKRIIS